MKIRKRLPLFAILFSFTDALAAGPLAARVDADGVAFEFQLPQLDVEADVVAGAVPYDPLRITAPGLRAIEEIGYPRLPGLSTFVALPPGAEPELTIVSDSVREVRGVWIAPIPASAKVGDDGGDEVAPYAESVYGRAGFFPSAAVELTMRGVARDVDFVKVEIRPVQWDSVSGVLRIHENLRFKIRFTESDADRQGAGTAPENLSLNPGSGIRSRGGHEPSLGSVRAEASSGGSDAFFINSPVPSAWHVRRPARPIVVASANRAANVESYRLTVSVDGLYRVTHVDLAAVGLGTPLVSDLLLEMRGDKIPFQVFDANGNGVFDNGDSFEFHGRTNPQRWTAANVYWLSLLGGGTKMVARAAFPPGSDALPAIYHSKSTVRFEANEARFAASTTDPSVWDPWVYTQPLQSGSAPCLGTPQPTRNFDLVATGVVAPTPGDVYEIRGRLSSRPLTGCIPPARRVDIGFNAAPVNSLSWDLTTSPTGMLQSFAYPYDASRVREGANTVELTQPSLAGKLLVTYIDHVEIDYEQRLQATNGVARFRGTWWPQGAVFHIGGFSTGSVEVVALRADGVVERVTAPRALSLGPGMPVTVSFAALPSQIQTEYVVMEIPKIGRPGIRRDTPSDLRAIGHRGEFTAIYADGLATESTALADYHINAEAMSSIAVAVEDVYDEFSWGNVDSEGIHDFLEYALANWEVPPLYVVLVGDSTDDPRGFRALNIALRIPHGNYMRQGSGSFNEIQLTSDAVYSLLVGGDSVPDLMLGRLAVQGGAEVTTYIEKVRQHETAAPAAWHSRSLVIIDDDLEGNDATCEPAINQWEQAVNDLTCCYLNGVPPGDHLTMMLDNYTLPAARDGIIAQHDQGFGSGIYYGHGSITKLGNKCGAALNDFFGSLDVPRLNNAATLPVFHSVSCNVARFDWVDVGTGSSRSMSEAFTTMDRLGHLAFVAQSTVTTANEGLGQIIGTYDGTYRPGSVYLPPFGIDPRARVGGLHFAAQMGYLYNITIPDARKDDNALTLILIGDPAVRHGVPLAAVPNKALCTRTSTPVFTCPP